MFDDIENDARMRLAVLSGLDNIIYVSDLETNNILYVNDNLQQVYEDKLLMGQCCWTALRDKDNQCEYCPIPYLLKNPGKSHRQKFYNELLGKTFWIQDSIIPWLDGRMAHLCSAVDITDPINKAL